MSFLKVYLNFLGLNIKVGEQPKHSNVNKFCFWDFIKYVYIVIDVNVNFQYEMIQSLTGNDEISFKNRSKQI